MVLWVPLLSSVGASSGPTEIPGVPPGQIPGWPLKVSSSLTLLVEEGGSPTHRGAQVSASARLLYSFGQCSLLAMGGSPHFNTDGFLGTESE